MHNKSQTTISTYITTEKDSILHRYFINLERQKQQQQTMMSPPSTSTSINMFNSPTNTPPTSTHLGKRTITNMLETDAEPSSPGRPAKQVRRVLNVGSSTNNL